MMRRVSTFARAAGAVGCILLASVAAYGQATWWDGAYTECEQVTIKAGAAAVPADYTVSLTFDHAALVAAGDSLASGDDVRVVYWDGGANVELDRVLNEGSSWDAATTMIWFKTQAAIAADASDSEYYLYYGNSSAASPPADKTAVYDIWDDFDDDVVDTDWTAVDLDGASAGATTESGTQLHVSGRGKDIWYYGSETPPETYDQQRLVYQGYTGDVLIEAKLDDVTFATNEWAKIGIIVKDTDVAESNYASMAATEGHGTTFQYNYTDSVKEFAYTTPVYLRVARVGNDATAYDSADCVTWTQRGTSQAIGYTDPVVVGISVTAHNDAETVTGDFDWFKARKYVDPEPVCIFFARIAVTPDPAYCAPSGTVDITAEPQDQLGNPFPVTVDWTTDQPGGTFNPASGTTDATNTTTTTTLTAGATTGTTFTVTATSTITLPGGATRDVLGTTTLDVSVPFLYAVNVTPASASILATDTVDITAAPIDQKGDPFTPAVTWTWSVSGGGSVSPTDQATTTFTSDGTAGTFTVTVEGDDGTDTATNTVTVEVLDPVAFHIKINCGYNSYTPAGWEDDDAYVSGGNDFENWPVAVDETGVANAAPNSVYQTVYHTGPHTYTIPVPNGDYIVRLHLGDGYETAGVPASRDTKYVIEGTTVEDHMDYSTEAGAPATALVRDYDVTVTDGDIVIECSGYSSDVFEAGLEIMCPVLTSVAVTPDPAYCLPSDSVVFTAEALNQYGDPFTADVTWTVSGGGSVDAGPALTTTFQSDGTEATFVVTASVTDGTNTFTDTADVIVAAPQVTTVNVTPQTATIGTGDTQDFTAETLDQFGDPITAAVTWTVTGDGSMSPGTGATSTFTPGSTEGTFTVTATADDGTYTVPGTAEIIVSDAPRVTTMTLTPATATIAQGDPVDYIVTTIDQFDVAMSADVTFSIDDPLAGTFVPVTVTTAAGTGMGTTTFTADGTSSGIFTVTATSGSATATAELVVIGSPVLTAVSISSNPDPAEIATGGSVALTAVPVDQFGQPFGATVTWTWSVSGGGAVSPTDQATTTFTSDGTEGTFTVTAEADDGTNTFQATVEIIVSAPVLTTITVSPDTVTMATGGTQDFTVEKLDQFGQPVTATITWSVSSNGTLSNETDDGVTYTASSAADTDILTATSGAVSGIADITVQVLVLTTVRVTPGSKDIDVGDSVTFTALTLDQFSPPNPFPATVTWTVSGGGSLNPTSGTTDATNTTTTTTFTSDGTVGTFTVTATADGVQGTAKVTVLETLVGLSIGEGCVPVSAGLGWGAMALALALFELRTRRGKHASGR